MGSLITRYICEPSAEDLENADKLLAECDAASGVLDAEHERLSAELAILAQESAKCDDRLDVLRTHRSKGCVGLI